MNTPKSDPLDRFRRAAKALRKAHQLGEASARQRIEAHPPRASLDDLKHADYLHVIAQENSFTSWPQLKFSVETEGLTRAALQQRLKIALFHGQVWRVDQLLRDTPDLARGILGLEIALYDADAVRAALAADPGAATRELGPRRPILHLAFSRMIHHWPDRRDAMIEIAELLVAHGADVNDSFVMEPGQGALSALYGAIGHSNNMALGQWLLDHGANPNDGESLYHSVELGHHDGLRMLLAAGADPKGTNALLHALDFQDHDAVRMLVEACVRADDHFDGDQGGEPSLVFPALFQAARRGSDRAMIDLLLQAGADPRASYQGASVWSAAHIYGNRDLIDALRALGAETDLSESEQALAAAALGGETQGYLDMAKLPVLYHTLLHDLIPLPERRDHIGRLVQIGMAWDGVDQMGLTPIQIAGWEGLPDLVADFLRHGPDLSHVNHYGGTLLGTIIHGSENCPHRATRDHVGAARLALKHGVALPRQDVELAGDADMAEMLADWAVAHPGQVIG